MLLDERQSVVDRGLMGPFDHSRNRRFGDRPQSRHRLHRRERQVIAGDRLRPWARVLGYLPGQLSGVDSFASVFCTEELTGHVGPHPRAIRSSNWRVGRQAGRGVDRGNASGDLEPERADITINDPERHPQPGYLLEVTFGEVRPFKLPLPELRQRVQATAEQRLHLLCSHRVTGGQTVDPIYAGTDPNSW